MTYSTPIERAELIGGLRDLADFLESNPEVPAHADTDMLTFPNGDWAEKTAEIDTIAARLGVTAYLAYGGHYVAARHFGPVVYRVVAIPSKESE